MSARVPQTLLVALLASAAAGAASAAQRHDGPAPVETLIEYRGAYAVTFSVRAPVPGAAYLCKARAVPRAPALEGVSLQAVPAVVNGLPTAGATGSWTNCTVEIPFAWVGTGASEASRALLSYEIDAISSTGAAAVPVTVQEGISVAYPPPGETLRLNFTLSF